MIQQRTEWVWLPIFCDESVGVGSHEPLTAKHGTVLMDHASLAPIPVRYMKMNPVEVGTSPSTWYPPIYPVQTPKKGGWKMEERQYHHTLIYYIYILYIHIYYTLTQRRYNENKMKPRRRYNSVVPNCSSSSSIGVIQLVVKVMVMAVMVVGSVPTVTAFRTSPWRRQRQRPQVPWGCHTTIVGRYLELEWSSVVDETHSPLLSSLSLSLCLGSSTQFHNRHHRRCRCCGYFPLKSMHRIQPPPPHPTAAVDGVIIIAIEDANHP